MYGSFIPHLVRNGDSTVTLWFQRTFGLSQERASAFSPIFGQFQDYVIGFKN